MIELRTWLHKSLQRLEKRVQLRIAIGVSIILFMTNLDSLIDLFLNTDKSYFNTEHLVVGGITGLVTTILFGMLSIYVAGLKRATKEIRTLEGLLPICSACHRIRTSDNHWHHLEKYISERTEATFTHGLCPDCAKELYPEMFRKRDSS